MVKSDRRRRREMKGLIEHLKSFSFHLRWLFLSPQARYAFLWAKTKKLGDLESTLMMRNLAVSVIK
jgi:hypothetical protein